MLLKETYLDKPDIAGVGLFSGEFILKGEVIWKNDPRTTIYWSIGEFNILKSTLPRTAFNNIERFAYVNNNKFCLNLDDSRFMNHSKNPTMGWDNKTLLAML